MLDKIVLWLIKRLVLLWDRHNDKSAFSFGKDEHTDYSVLVKRFYDDHYTIGTAIYPQGLLVPVRHGRWLVKTVRGDKRTVCSECLIESGTCYEDNYCPNCGARMDLKES